MTDFRIKTNRKDHYQSSDKSAKQFYWYTFIVSSTEKMN